MTLPGPNLPDSAAGAVSVATLPTRELQSVFAGYRCFNAVQSASFQAAFATDSNLVLSAPTGSGKTAVLELAICRLLHQNLSKSFKLVYVAPTKSLCRERAKDWSSKFSAFGLTCAEVTGDTDARNMHQVKTADIIITTPEKWDSVTRRWNDSQRLVQMVKLFMVDEVHSLNSSRGATLEVVMTRMKQMARVGVRMIALSATVPNLEDLARWLGKGHDGGLALQLKFGENYRPVALERVVYGFEMGRMNKFAFDSFLAKQVYGVVAKHGKGKPSIIFCSTRQDCQNTAKAVLQAYETQPMWSRPSIDAVFADKALMQMVPAGVAFHHAGLSLADRNMVEKLFRQNVLNVLVSTSTLAVGVNLPAHLVVLKNTLVYSHGAFEEYSDLDVLQMIGRAGRPQFDTTGCAVIMTGNEKKRTYELMISGTEVLESHLHLALLEHFNAEICSGTISTVQQSIEWLKETFLYVRMQQNPAHYRLQEGHGVEETLKQMSEMNVALLEQKKLVDNIDGKLISTPKGKIMANYYLCFSSFENLDSLPTGASESDILTALCKADEFSKMSLRPGDKGMLNIMKTLPGLRFPIVGKIEHLWQKVFLAVQITPGSVDVSVLKASHPRNMTELFVHESFIRQHMLRLLSCLIDCKLLDKDATIINRALELRQAIAGKCWKTSAGVLKQIRGIGDGSLKTLVNAGITTLPKLIQSDARELERLFKRHPPFGNKLIKDAESLPSLSLSIRLSGQAVKPDGVHLQFDVRLSALCPTEWRADQHLVNFTAYTANGLLLDFRRQKMDKLLGGKQILLDVHLMKHCSNLGFLVICEDLVSCEARSSFVLEISAADYPEQNEPARDSSSDGWLEVIGMLSAMWAFADFR
ncbi:P-loop containing nucleoside triphosphate hydrolase protein [Protomyces lactucae-debilis]|uniref:DNA 3'-5' helicase n=1 Tax=Protomyces lactucae-debilis TaxID=2754530 RepID=A0A1Y2FH99_PROLT|nr:P-loop containing nucleoside triphosphate hydrolase protein [Protomyces lactucae-debilis]ORY83303.1 P-loop containing nucleoside triphosphate hydrolase protein [Protomyces lactucae-debilis]